MQAISHWPLSHRVNTYGHRQSGSLQTGGVEQIWITAVGAKTAYIALGSPCENVFVENLMPGFGSDTLLARVTHQAADGLKLAPGEACFAIVK